MDNYYFFKVPHETVTDEKFKASTPATMMLFIYLCQLTNMYGNSEGWFFRSMRDLEKDTGLHLQTLTEAKKALVKSNYISIKKGKYESKNFRASDWYKINT